MQKCLSKLEKSNKQTNNNTLTLYRYCSSLESNFPRISSVVSPLTVSEHILSDKSHNKHTLMTTCEFRERFIVARHAVVVHTRQIDRSGPFVGAAPWLQLRSALSCVTSSSAQLPCGTSVSHVGVFLKVEGTQTWTGSLQLSVNVLNDWVWIHLSLETQTVMLFCTIDGVIGLRRFVSLLFGSWISVPQDSSHSTSCTLHISVIFMLWPTSQQSFLSACACVCSCVCACVCVGVRLVRTLTWPVGCRPNILRNPLHWCAKKITCLWETSRIYFGLVLVLGADFVPSGSVPSCRSEQSSWGLKQADSLCSSWLFDCFLSQLHKQLNSHLTPSWLRQTQRWWSHITFGSFNTVLRDESRLHVVLCPMFSNGLIDSNHAIECAKHNICNVFLQYISCWAGS